MFGRGADIGIDLGTASVLVYIKGQGIVLQEPSIVAINENTNEVIAVGEEASAMIGRTPIGIKSIRPLRQGVISDYDVAEKMLKYFIHKAIGQRLVKPRIAVCVPSGVTEVEKKAVEDATRQAGARRVDIIEEPIAAAIGAGIDIGRPCGSMIVDIGGGTTDVAVISLGSGVVSRSLKLAGNDFDEAIMKYVRKKHGVLIGERTAEKIKMTIGSASPREEVQEIEARGRNLITGLPKGIMIGSDEIQEALAESVASVVDTVHLVLESTPPELAADISDRGIVLTGGGSMLYGLDKLIEQRTGITAVVAENPISCVAIGTGLFVEYKYSNKRRNQYD
ncbi:MAG: rod shape-determining protein [Cellulosilyticaceae bacterium]